MPTRKHNNHPPLRCLALLSLLLCPAYSSGAQEQQRAAVSNDTAVEKKTPPPAEKAEKIEKGVKAEKADAAADKTPAANAESPEDRADFWKQLRYSFELGGQFRSVSGERPSKFEETKRVREGLLFRRFTVTSNPEGTPSFFRLLGRGPTEIDQHFLLDAGRYGRFRATFEFLGLPRLFARGGPSLLAAGGDGVLTVPDAVRQTLQSLDTPLGGSVAPPNPALVNAARGFVANVPKINLRVQRQRLDYTQTFDLTDHWSFRFRLLDYKRYGQRPLGTGSYERIGTPTGDTFRVISIELPEQVDFRSDELTFGTSYTRDGWGLNFDYTYSKFSNRVESLVFDNPFRLTDQQATGAGGVFNRYGFARAAYALPPSNEAHGVMLRGFVDLPRDSRYAAALGWSRWTQDEQFLPYTLNTALTAPNLPAGTDLSDAESLPQQSLDGEVDVWTHDHLFTSQLTSRLGATVHYRAYDYNNKTAPIHFPGYAGFPDSFWRTSISGLGGRTRAIENEPSSFLRQRLTADLSWDVTDSFSWRGEYEWEGWDREHRQVDRSSENKVGTFFSYRPTKRFTAKLKYRYSDRTPDNYDPGVLENPNLRMFDQAKRLRHETDLQWQWLVRPGLGLSGTFGYLSDDYDQNFFGLAKYIQRYGSADLVYNPRENTTLYVNYAREHYNSSLQTISKTAVPFDQRNRWNRDDRNVFDSFGVGLTTYLADGKWYFDAQYALGFGSDRMTTVNVAEPSPINLLNAQAFPFPDSKSRYHELNLDTSYQLTGKVALGVRYIYEPYRLDDWQWNGLNPYPTDFLAPENDGRRYLILDSRYTSHNAHVVGIYLRFSR
jgi:MtrB/PioB family decaheme-associated outer membrane protein